MDAPPLPEARGPVPSHPGTTVVDGEDVDGPIIWRRDLRPGHEVEGPALVLDYSATTWLPPGWGLTVHPFGVLRMRRT